MWGRGVVQVDQTAHTNGLRHTTHECVEEMLPEPKGQDARDGTQASICNSLSWGVFDPRNPIRNTEMLCLRVNTWRPIHKGQRLLVPGHRSTKWRIQGNAVGHQIKKWSPQKKYEEISPEPLFLLSRRKIVLYFAHLYKHTASTEWHSHYGLKLNGPQ